MKKPWFKKKGWIHHPISREGYFALLFFLLFAVNIVVIVGARSGSATATFYGVFPYVVSIFFLYEWIAWHKSIDRK
ncbi:MAG: hypothetical protein WCJ57_00240 [Candidatus Falkowbacteria bacterium]